ncbi:translocation/assembly module TamB domain-containing protein [Formosa sp. S-31]|uniref:translocation/assembly module TamB domain-containing protein n=1 Tax=Formosa sp. S-31 TaxID=2790949 RepID=UPI003EC111EC
MGYVTSFISEKTHTKVEINRLFLTFSGDLKVDGVYLEDQKGDTLIYSKSLEANAPLWPIIRGKGVGVESLEWEGLRANIFRTDSISGYNFQFLIDAFVSEEPEQPQQPEPDSAPMDIIVENIHLNDFKIVFNDAVLGIDSRFNLGDLTLDMDTFDLENMTFRVSEAAIKDTDINYIQSPVSESKDTTTTPLPFLAIDNFKLKNVKANYLSVADSLELKADINTFQTRIPEIDLTNNHYKVEELELTGSSIVLNTKSTNEPETETETETENTTPADSGFEWPEITLEIADINFENNAIGYFVNDEKPEFNTFNANAIQIDHLTLNGEQIYLKNKTAGLTLNQFQFKEASGIQLNKANFTLKVTDNNLNLEDIFLSLNNNTLSGESKITYASLSDLTTTPEQSKIALNLNNLQLDLNDLFRFQPELKTNPYLDSLSQKPVTGHLHASGDLTNIQLTNTGLNWGKTTQISANGAIQNVTDTEQLELHINPFSAEMLKDDLLKFANEQDLGIQLPDFIKLNGTLDGTLTNIKTNARLETSQGLVSLEGYYNSSKGMAFDTEIKIDEYKLNELLQNDQLGPLSLSLKASGKGTSINDLDAVLDAKISSFKLQNYQITDLPITGELNNGSGDISSSYKDDNINLELKSHLVLDSIAPEVIVDLNLIGINLQALGLMQRDVRAGLKLHADFKGNGDNFDLQSNIDDGVFVYNKKTFLLGDLVANAHVEPDTTYVFVNNKLLNLELESNTNPQTFSTALQNHLKSYFYKDSTFTDSTQNVKPVNIKVKGKLSQSALLNDVFVLNLKDIDTIDLNLDFIQDKKILNANITAPHINYSDNELDSLALSIATNPDKFDFNLGFKAFNSGPISIKRTAITGNKSGKDIDLGFTAFDDDDLLMQLRATLSAQKDSLKLIMNPDSLIINKEVWTIPESNQMVYTPKALHFKDFKISKNEQALELTNASKTNNAQEELTIRYTSFGLKELLSYFNPDKELAQGQLNGHFTIHNPFEDQGYVADLEINQFKILNADLGTLSLIGNSGNNKTYDFNIKTKGGDVDIDITGDYVASKDNPNITVDMAINDIKMEAVEGLSLGELSNSSGSLSGHFSLSGSTSAPQYNGNLDFNTANFTVTKLNTNFVLENETINIDNQGISMSDFTILDNNNSALVFNGYIGTEDFSNPTFNLDISAKDFQVLNATPEENDMLYGILSFNTEGTITGDLNVPVVNLNASVNPESNVTYVMPSSAVNIEERDGVVIFVNRNNPDAILTREVEEASTVTGFDVKANFAIPKEAVMTLVLDENTGDNFQTSGDGEFVFTMDTNGRMNLSGVYTVDSGHYEMSLYQLVNRKFELVPGSRVSWSGNPLDANLSVKALYDIKTSSSPLMASQISGSDPAVKNKYKQVLPFQVYLNIDGELMHPKISFKLDMPEDEQGAIGGQVYGRVQQVNQQEGELNRQVFSLLVMSRFYPESGSDGSDGGFASIARDNLNDALSDQLNMFSDKLLGNTGLELDFGLNSFTDYQGSSPEQRTQLDVAAQKKLFNDRVIVRVGSAVDIEGSDPTGEEAPLIGDVSLEYLITPSGKYRLKAFQKNEFESVIDGQTIVSGLALIFTQEFNEFQELWAAMFHSDKEREAQKAENEKNKKAKDE